MTDSLVTRAQTYLQSAEGWLEDDKTHQEATAERAQTDALVAIGYGLLAVTEQLRTLNDQTTLRLDLSGAKENHGRDDVPPDDVNGRQAQRADLPSRH